MVRSPNKELVHTEKKSTEKPLCGSQIVFPIERVQAERSDPLVESSNIRTNVRGWIYCQIGYSQNAAEMHWGSGFRQLEFLIEPSLSLDDLLMAEFQLFVPIRGTFISSINNNYFGSSFSCLCPGGYVFPFMLHCSLPSCYRVRGPAHL